MLGTSDTWSMSRWSQRPSNPAYYIEDCRIYSVDSIIEQQLEVLTTRLLVRFMMLPFPLTNELEVFNNKELHTLKHFCMPGP